MPVAAAEVGNWNTQKLDALLADVATESSGNVVAYRGNHRWTRTYSPLPLAPTNAKPTLLRQRGIYLITGGLGGVGLLLAEYLARTVQAKLVLTGRSEVPPRSQWSEWLASPDNDERITEKLKAISALKDQVLKR